MSQYSISGLNNYQSCNRRFYYEQELNLKAPGFAKNPAYGQLIHAAMVGDKELLDAVTALIEDHPDNVEEIEMLEYQARIVASIHRRYWAGYEGSLSNQNVDFLSREEKFNFELDKVDTIRGIRDGYVDISGKKYLYELKTSGDVSRDVYKARLEVDPQIGSYIIGLLEEKKHVEGVLYDIIWKPNLRRKKNRKTMPDETLEDFAKRTIEAYADEPAKYFERVLVFRDDTELVTHWHEIEHTVKQINTSRKDKMWTRNSNSCTQWGSMCPFFNPCMDIKREKEYLKNYEQRKAR